MSSTRGPRALTRRQLLKVAGAAAATLAAPGLALPAYAARSELRVVLLAPASSRYPAAADEFATGVERALAASGRAARLQRATLSAGQRSAPAQLAGLFDADRPAVALGLMGADAAPALHATLEQHNTLFVAADTGANIPRHGEHSPRVLQVSLGAWQASYALGAWAARRSLRRAAVALSFYESGYDLPYAFRSGFEQGGGAILATEVTGAPTGTPGDLPAALQRLADTGPDVVYAAYSGPEAAAFLRAYAASPLGGRVPLLGPGFLVDNAPRARQDPAARGALTALAWGGDPFAGFGRAPAGPFTALGYEAALLALHAAEHAGDYPHDLAPLAASLAGARLASPRGALSFDPHTLSLHADLVLREVRATPAGLRNVAIGTLPAVSLDEPSLATLRAAPRTGWLNGYLCV